MVTVGQIVRGRKRPALPCEETEKPKNKKARVDPVLIEIPQQQDPPPEAPKKSPKRHNYSMGICF
jgi:hypothetical protein